MRAYRKIVIDIATDRVVHRDEVLYAASSKVALAKGGGGGSTTTQSLPPWLEPYARSFIESYGSQAFTLPDGTPFTGQWSDLAPGQTLQPLTMPNDLQLQIAGFTPEQSAAMGMMSGVTGGAQNLANIGGAQNALTMSGAYLNPGSNPYLDATFDAAARRMTDAYSTATAPGITAQAQRQGQFGSSAMNEALALSRYDLGDNLKNLGTSIYGGNYAAERDRQMQALGMNPTTIQNLYAPGQALYGVGALQQEQTQQELDTGYANAANAAEWPFNVLSGFGSAIGQAAGGGGSSTTKTKGGGGMFGSVICTALHDQGWMDDATFAADEQFGRQVSLQVYLGYYRWARYVAAAMRKSRVLTACVAPIALAWAKEMRAQVERRPNQGSWLGKQIMRVGLPLCGWLGRSWGKSWA